MSYAEKKAEIRQKAIDWQSELCNTNYSYEELVNWADYFMTQGKRYGLLREFKDNGII